MGEWERIRRDYLSDWVGTGLLEWADPVGDGGYPAKGLSSLWDSAH